MKALLIFLISFSCFGACYSPCPECDEKGDNCAVKAVCLSEMPVCKTAEIDLTGFYYTRRAGSVDACGTYEKAMSAIADWLGPQDYEKTKVNGFYLSFGDTPKHGSIGGPEVRPEIFLHRNGIEVDSIKSDKAKKILFHEARIACIMIERIRKSNELRIEEQEIELAKKAAK